MEYKLAPSPIRANYLSSQALNPISQLTYLKRIYSISDRDDAILANSATETSLFDLFPDSLDYIQYSGIAIRTSATSTNTALLFPPNFFRMGDVIRIRGAGDVISNIENADLTLYSYKLQADWGNGAPSTNARMTLQTDPTVDVDDLVDTRQGFFFDIYHQISQSVSPTIIAVSAGLLIYRNKNSIQGDDTKIDMTFGNVALDLTTTLAINITFKWDTANVANSVRLRMLWIEVF